MREREEKDILNLPKVQIISLVNPTHLSHCIDWATRKDLVVTKIKLEMTNQMPHFLVVFCSFSIAAQYL
jgi:hypothetical protein